ncbi:hypothetical protein ACS0TY_026580 [Phlomoides rotata]
MGDPVSINGLTKDSRINITLCHSESSEYGICKGIQSEAPKGFSSSENARRALGIAFEKSLKVVKQSLEEYSSPDFRGNHDETEAIQRLHFHTAMTNLKHVLWLVERMIELRVADMALKAWTDQAPLIAYLKRFFLMIYDGLFFLAFQPWWSVALAGLPMLWLQGIY